MEANYFTIVLCFLPYVDMNQPRVYMCPPSRPSWSSQSTELSSLCYTAGSLKYFTHGSGVSMSMLLFRFIPSSLLPIATHLFSTSSSLFHPANRHISTFFYIPHICVSITYLFSSFWLILLYITDLKSIHISTNDQSDYFFYG